MGTSFIEFRGDGFWARDGHLIYFAELFINSVKADWPMWFPKETKSYYIGLSKDQVGVGCITLFLDSLLTDNSKLQWFRIIVENMDFDEVHGGEFLRNLVQLLQRT